MRRSGRSLLNTLADGGRGSTVKMHMILTGRRVIRVNLTPREIDKLMIYQVAELARRRRDRGTKLNLTEAQALISEAILEAARDGKSVAECMELAPTWCPRPTACPGSGSG